MTQKQLRERAVPGQSQMVDDGVFRAFGEKLTKQTWLVMTVDRSTVVGAQIIDPSDSMGRIAFDATRHRIGAGKRRSTNQRLRALRAA